MPSNIILPLYYLVIEISKTTWYFKTSDRIFYNPRNVPITLSLDERLQRFDLTIPKVAIELFRINAGRGGYYLANLQSKQYYYCGLEWQDVKTTLHQLGIGRPDPQERY